MLRKVILRSISIKICPTPWLKQRNGITVLEQLICWARGRDTLAPLEKNVDALLYLTPLAAAEFPPVPSR